MSKPPRFFVFLDTQVFDSNAYDFQNKHFSRIKELASEGMIQLVLPEITKREIDSHITEKSQEAYAALDKFRRSGFQKNLRIPPFDALATGTSAENIRKELTSHFEDFCKATNLIHIPMSGLSLDAIIDDYFGKKPPFGSGKKKSEFPDAIAAQLLSNWCKQNSNIVVIVSGDGDWQSIDTKAFDVVEGIAKLLDRFPDPAMASRVREVLQSYNEFAKSLRRAFEDTPFYDINGHGDIVDLEVNDLRIGKLYVTNIKNGCATVETSVEFDFSATARGTRLYELDDDDEESSYWIEKRFSLSRKATATIEVYLDDDDPDSVDFGRPVLSEMSPYLYVQHFFEP